MQKASRTKLAAVFLTVCFLIKSGDLICTYGTECAVNATLERISMEGVKSFLDEGFFTHRGLPVVRFVHETPVPELQNKKVYTHFLSGDVFVSALLLKALGGSTDPHSALQPLRVLLAILGLLSLLFFALQANRHVLSREFSWGLPILLTGLYLCPTFYNWNLTFTGVSYSNFCMLLLMGLGMQAQAKPNTLPFSWITALCFLLGLVSIYMYLAIVFVACLAPFLGAALVPGKFDARKALTLSLFTGFGITAGYLLHFWQVASELQSWSLAWLDQIGTFLNRSGAEMDKPVPAIEVVGQYSEHVRAFFRLNALHMTFSGLFLAWMLPNDRARSAITIALATVVSYVWILLMKRSSLIHYFLFPQIFLTLYLVWLVLLVRCIEFRALKKMPPN